FSSRRRHTRFSRDWSSDVCSSDLAVRPAWLLLPWASAPTRAGKQAFGQVAAVCQGRSTVRGGMDMPDVNNPEAAPGARFDVLVRSEERRVGKGSGSRRAAEA